MYVVKWGFTDGDVYLDTNDVVVHDAEEVVIFREDADALIRSLQDDPDTVDIELYECTKIDHDPMKANTKLPPLT